MSDAAVPGPGCSDGDLVARFGSPLFVYDGELIRRRWAALRAAMPEACAVHFAAKANPSLGVLALLRSLGAGAEVASRGELLAALRAGFAPDRILWAGPAKTDAELDLAVATGVRAVHAESDEEIRRLDAIGRARGAVVDAGVRVHVPWSAGESNRIIGGGAPSKFGIAEDDARRLAPAWARLAGVRLRSVHVFSASNVRDAEALVAAWTRTLELARALAELGLPVDLVDLGGGLGVPYADGEAPLDVVALGRGLAGALDRVTGGSFAPRVAIEPGRYLVAEAGRYVMRVVSRKTSAGVTYLACDGGIHHLLRPALVGQAHAVSAAGESPAAPRAAFRVVGPLCTALDDFGEHALPETTGVGEILSVANAGAYGFTEAMPFFLSHPIPAEVMLLDGAAHLLRPRLDPDALLPPQLIPTPLTP